MLCPLFKIERSDARITNHPNPSKCTQLNWIKTKKSYNLSWQIEIDWNAKNESWRNQNQAKPPKTWKQVECSSYATAITVRWLDLLCCCVVFHSIVAIRRDEEKNNNWPKFTHFSNLLSISIHTQMTQTDDSQPWRFLESTQLNPNHPIEFVEYTSPLNFFDDNVLRKSWNFMVAIRNWLSCDLSLT